MSGGAGNDTLYGGDGNDVVSGGDGNDLIIGGDGAGDDIYYGGSGIDTIKYTSAKAGIKVDLTLSSGNATSISGNDAAGIGTDKISGVENIISGNFNDVLIGDGNDNEISGDGGNDTIDGGNGYDTAVYSGAKSQYKIVKNADGSVTVTDLRPVGFSDGVDRLTNVEVLRFSDQFVPLTVDPSKLKAPIITTLSSAVGVAQPTIVGLAPANNTVTVFDGSILIGSIKAGTDGTWSLTPTTALSAGTHSITARAKDLAGNVSSISDPISLAVYLGPPSKPVLTINTPFTNATMPTITGTAQALSTVTIYDGTTQIGTTSSSLTGNWQFVAAKELIEGAHSITATATDPVGNVSPRSTAIM